MPPEGTREAGLAGPADETPSISVRRVLEEFPDAVLDWHNARGDDTVVVKREAIVALCRFLKQEPGLHYNLFLDLTAADYLPREPRFEVVIHLYSVPHKHRLRLKVPLSEGDPSMDTLTGVWRGTDWFEREAWDMYGIVFHGHPNLKRVLLYEAFEGHPLRKDYPIERRQPIIGPKN
jgi:NADH-quinone oxidoreductase subunit C